MKRHSPSKVDLLPPPIKATVGRLIAANYTIDQIVAKLRELEAAGEDFDMPSRSGVGRYAERLRAAQKRIADSAAIAEALSPEFGDEDKRGRVAAELLKAGIFDLLTAVEIDEETGEAKAVQIGPDLAKTLAAALRDLSQAAKIDADRTLKVRQEAAKEAAKAVDRVAKTKGLTRETVDDIKFAVLGIAKT